MIHSNSHSSNFSVTLLNDRIIVIGGWSDETNSTIANVESWKPYFKQNCVDTSDCDNLPWVAHANLTLPTNAPKYSYHKWIHYMYHSMHSHIFNHVMNKFGYNMTPSEGTTKDTEKIPAMTNAVYHTKNYIKAPQLYQIESNYPHLSHNVKYVFQEPDVDQTRLYSDFIFEMRQKSCKKFVDTNKTKVALIIEWHGIMDMLALVRVGLWGMCGSSSHVSPEAVDMVTDITKLFSSFFSELIFILHCIVAFFCFPGCYSSFLVIKSAQKILPKFSKYKCFRCYTFSSKLVKKKLNYVLLTFSVNNLLNIYLLLSTYLYLHLYKYTYFVNVHITLYKNTAHAICTYIIQCISLIVMRVLPQRSFSIFVKLYTGKTLVVYTSQTHTIRSLKSSIEDRTELPAVLQRLIYLGRQLNDADTVKSCKITRDSTLFLVLRLKGGMHNDDTDNDESVTQAMKFTSTSNARVTSSVNYQTVPYIRQSPATWFRKLEGMFELKNIKNDRKRFLVAFDSLPDDISTEVPPDMDSYEELKTLVSSFNDKSQHQKIKEALDDFRLDGRKPSHFIRHCKTKLEAIGLHPSEDVLKNRLLEAMPEEARLTLVGNESLPINNFVTIADNIYDLLQRTSKLSINAVDCKTFNRPPRTVKEPAKCAVQQPRGNYGHQPYYEGQRQQICRAHLYYAEKARCCKVWCKWPGPKPAYIAPTSRASSRAASPTADPLPHSN